MKSLPTGHRLWLSGLVVLLTGPLSHAQTWTAAIQMLPTKQVVQTAGGKVDSATYQQTAALRAQLFRQAARLLKQRSQYFWQADSARWHEGHFYRVPTATCHCVVLALENPLEGFVLTLTPAGAVADVCRVAEFEPAFWHYSPRAGAFQGRFSYTRATKFTCTAFQTEHVVHRLNRRHAITATTRTVANYRITAAGKIQRLPSQPPRKP